MEAGYPLVAQPYLTLVSLADQYDRVADPQLGRVGGTAGDAERDMWQNLSGRQGTGGVKQADSGRRQANFCSRRHPTMMRLLPPVRTALRQIQAQQAAAQDLEVQVPARGVGIRDPHVRT